MCDPVTIGLVIAGVGAASSVAGVLGQKSPKIPAAPQEAKSPDINAIKRRNATAFGGGMGGGTNLTGSQGLAPGSQNVGRTTLLGG